MSNEGLNINADVLLILDAANMNTDRCTQTAGRIQRTSSTRNAVNVVLFGGSEDYLRLRYTVIMAEATTGNNPWTFEYDTLPRSEWLWKAFTLMKIMCGDDPCVADAAICLLITRPDPPIAARIMAWWKDRRRDSLLTEHQVTILLSL